MRTSLLTQQSFRTRKNASMDLPVMLWQADQIWTKLNDYWDGLTLIKEYNLRVKCGEVQKKKVLYMNERDISIRFSFKSNMPNVVQILNDGLVLEPKQRDYIRFIINAPSTPCKLQVRIALLDDLKEKNNLEEGINFNIIVSTF